MKIEYYCEYCGEHFNNKEECIEHEKECDISFPIKIITINKALNEKNEIKIFTYPNAKKFGNNIQFIPNKVYIDNVYVSSLFLDNIKSLEDYYAIHTTNFDLKYEKECVKKLLDYKKEVLKEAIEDWIKTFKEHLNEIENKDVNIIIKDDYDKMIDEYED